MSLALQNIISHFSRLKVTHTVCYNGFHSSAILGIKLSEPHSMRSTPSIQTQLPAQKIERKKNKIARDLRRLAKRQRTLKPVEEKFLWPSLKKDLKSGLRTRTDKLEFSMEEKGSHVLLLKEWTRYKNQQVKQERAVISRAIKRQEHALKKLQEASEELYLKALELDDSTYSYKTTGPCETPPKENYDAQDGKYVDKTEYFIEEKFYEPDPKVKQALTLAKKRENMKS